MKQRKAERDRIMMQQLTEAVRGATPEALEMALKALKKNGTKRRKKPSRFKGSDHFLTREEFEKLCQASTPFYATIWRMMAKHALRVSEICALRPCNVEGGYLTVQRLKGSQRTVQPLLVDLSEQLKSGTYRLFPVHRSTIYLHFRKAARAIGLRPDLQHDHVLRLSSAHWMLDGGANLAITSQWLGHSSLQSTAAYLHVSDRAASSAAERIIGRQ